MQIRHQLACVENARFCGSKFNNSEGKNTIRLYSHLSEKCKNTLDFNFFPLRKRTPLCAKVPILQPSFSSGKYSNRLRWRWVWRRGGIAATEEPLPVPICQPLFITLNVSQIRILFLERRFMENGMKYQSDGTFFPIFRADDWGSRLFQNVFSTSDFHTPPAGLLSRYSDWATGWTVRDRIPVGMRFSARPDQPWDPPSLL